jgi:hypothetical protein
LHVIVDAHVAIGEIRERIDVDGNGAVGEVVGKKSPDPGVAGLGVGSEPQDTPHGSSLGRRFLSAVKVNRRTARPPSWVECAVLVERP